MVPGVHDRGVPVQQVVDDSPLREQDGLVHRRCSERVAAEGQLLAVDQVTDLPQLARAHRLVDLVDLALWKKKRERCRSVAKCIVIESFVEKILVVLKFLIELFYNNLGLHETNNVLYHYRFCKQNTNIGSIYHIPNR